MILTLPLVCLCALPVLGLPTPTEPSTTLIVRDSNAGTNLNNAATTVAGQKWFGTAANIPGEETDDKYYMNEFEDFSDFGGATPINAMKFDVTEQEQDDFDFSEGDEFVRIAKDSGKDYIRCHNLIWSSALPDWLCSPSTPWTKSSLSAVLTNHIQTVIKHFGNDCYSWDVVNEAFSDDPATYYEHNIWYDTIGSEYIPMAFEAAAQAVTDNDLQVKLYYNDYGIEYAGDKSTAVQNLVKLLKYRGIQIDGVGFESHFKAGDAPEYDAQVENLQAFTSLGVEVAITELDVRVGLPVSDTETSQQAEDYYNTVKACVDVDGCVGITVWDFADTYSWVPETYQGWGSADLFYQPDGAGSALVKKNAYNAVLQALSGESLSV